MIKFKISKVKYDPDRLVPYRSVSFRYTPELAQDVSSHMVMDTKEIAMQEFGMLLDELNKPHGNGAFTFDVTQD